jgi:hypothetical protein
MHYHTEVKALHMSHLC